MEVEGERAHCSKKNSGDTGTLFKRSLRLRCRDGRAVQQRHRVQCAHEITLCQGRPELLQLDHRSLFPVIVLFSCDFNILYCLSLLFIDKNFHNNFNTMPSIIIGNPEIAG